MILTKTDALDSGDTLPETNELPVKMDGWNTTFLLGRPIFRGYVSFRECIFAVSVYFPTSLKEGAQSMDHFDIIADM